MRFDIMTLFPEYVDMILSESIIGRARNSGIIEINTYNIRDYTEDRHRRVDDTPYGGGRGMLMQAPPIYACYEAVKKSLPPDSKTLTVYMSPKGKVLDQATARMLSGYDGIVVLCGHYEGCDQRAIDRVADEEISVGDYVLTGGELPACILVDCVSRLCPGVLAADECFEKESFSERLLEYPQYTRPYEFMGECVPDVLLGGNHAEIEKWRREQAQRLTREKRPDLLDENKD